VAQVQSLSRSRLQRLLLTGFGVSGLLLLSALLVGIRTVHTINSYAQTFTDTQATAKATIDQIQKEQADLNNRWLRLARRKDVLSREEVLAQLADNRKQMSDTLDSAYKRAEDLRKSIRQQGHGLLRWTVWLFAACVGLSLGVALWVVRASAGLFGRLEQQASELTRLQYQFLETQENVARRFSHELHDELGQTLTATKANLAALRGNYEQARVDDCMRLVDQAIQEVRAMSQLLRPTILDDFGLDAALKSLTDSFAQRTGIKVDYRSSLDGRRLGEQAETHLFRIAQEALTNIARHSQATAVTVELSGAGKEASLSIRDNGRGFDLRDTAQARGLGLAGMETRARGCGGVLKLDSSPGKGAWIEVTCAMPELKPAQVA
jgi:signal transduction histidine kinase